MLRLQQLVMQRVASKAASRAAASFTWQLSHAGRKSAVVSPAGSVLSCRQLSRRLEALTEVVVTPQGEQEEEGPTDVEAGGVLMYLVARGFERFEQHTMLPY
jgi:hypothetical protein